jgi:CheY-like chemotaxis protein
MGHLGDGGNACSIRLPAHSLPLDSNARSRWNHESARFRIVLPIANASGILGWGDLQTLESSSDSQRKDTAGAHKPCRILIADDHEALRRGLRSALLGAGWQVVGEASDGQETIQKVRELKPDLLLLDLSMPVMNGHDAAREILRTTPGMKIVVFTMHESPQVRDALRKIGVHGLAVKSAPLSLLLDTIQGILDTED